MCADTVVSVSRTLGLMSQFFSSCATRVRVLCASSHLFSSLVNSIVRGHAYRTVGTLEEVSTVGIDLLPHNLSGTAVEFYDCAGQVDYLGMHQTFLTRRALYLLVWDVSKCEGKAGDELDEVSSTSAVLHRRYHWRRCMTGAKEAALCVGMKFRCVFTSVFKHSATS